MERHEEILAVVLQQSWTSQEQIAAYIEQADKHAAECEKRLEIVLQRLDEHGEILADHDGRLDNHGGRLDDHDRRLDDYERRLDDHERRLRALEKQFSQTSFGTRPQQTKEEKKDEIYEISDKEEEDDDDEAVQILEVRRPDDKDILTIVLNYQQLAKFDAAMQQDDDSLITPHVWGKDFKSLRPGVWMDDGILNDFMSLLGKRCKSSKSLPQCHFFSTHFYAKLTEKIQGVRSRFHYDAVRRWSRKAEGGDIFALDYLFVPINKSNCHWALLVVDMEKVSSTKRLRNNCNFGNT